MNPSSAADQLLNNVSGGFAEMILQIAGQAAEKDAVGPRVVTADDIKEVMNGICAVMEQGLQTGAASEEVRAQVQQLREFCQRIPCDPSGAGFGLALANQPVIPTESVSAFITAVHKEMRIAALERENAWLRAEAVTVAATLISQVVAITTELFGSASVYEDSDPEFSDDKYVVFAVESAANISEILEKEREWIARVQRVAPHWHSVRLSVRPV